MTGRKLQVAVWTSLHAEIIAVTRQGNELGTSYASPFRFEPDRKCLNPKQRSGSKSLV